MKVLAGYLSTWLEIPAFGVLGQEGWEFTARLCQIGSLAPAWAMLDPFLIRKKKITVASTEKKTSNLSEDTLPVLFFRPVVPQLWWVSTSSVLMPGPWGVAHFAWNFGFSSVPVFFLLWWSTSTKSNLEKKGYILAYGLRGLEPIMAKRGSVPAKVGSWLSTSWSTQETENRKWNKAVNPQSPLPLMCFVKQDLVLKVPLPPQTVPPTGGATCSDTWAYGGHCSFKPPQPTKFLRVSWAC